MSGYTLPRMNLRQVLDNNREHKVTYYAVIIDPETGKRIVSVPIFTADSGEVVDLSIETQTNKDR